MTPTKSLSPFFILLFGTAVLLISCGRSSDQTENIPTENAAASMVPSKSETKNPTDTVKEAIAADTTVDTAPTEEPEEPAPAPDMPATDDTSSNANKSSGKLAERTVNEERLGIILDLISEDLESQQLEYISSKGQDCSGIYHKIKDLVQKKMSVLGDKTKFHYPTFSKDRNSRQIADWYYRHDNLHIVQDANKDRNLITPGTVVFFGRTEEKYSNITIDLLTNPGKFVHDGTNGKIMHIAIVTTVEKDDAGNVIKYDMMHGRNSRNFASRTTANYDGPGSYAKKHAKFPFGNWNQQLVALAHIETPK
ncbi:MAG: hypothetical protein RIC19_21530 [Phaeodactylibacter sp.]|uniref:hypothetical protein n=1 Tax=Phaeodactylibacter sp. TaxID=1940289 RepID=UPI0032EE1B6F